MKAELWIVCCVEERTMRHFVMECGELQEIRQYGTEAFEEVLMFREKNEEKVNQCKMMLKEMRRRRVEQM